MNVGEPVKSLLARNPGIEVKRVEAFLQYLQQLEAAGVYMQSRYGITHPFAGQPEFVRTNSIRSLNQIASRK